MLSAQFPDPSTRSSFRADGKRCAHTRRSFSGWTRSSFIFSLKIHQLQPPLAHRLSHNCRHTVSNRRYLAYEQNHLQDCHLLSLCLVTELVMRPLQFMFLFFEKNPPAYLPWTRQ